MVVQGGHSGVGRLAEGALVPAGNVHTEEVLSQQRVAVVVLGAAAAGHARKGGGLLVGAAVPVQQVVVQQLSAKTEKQKKEGLKLLGLYTFYWKRRSVTVHCKTGRKSGPDSGVAESGAPPPGGRSAPGD